MRIGIGYDVHALTEGRKLVLGGIEIPFSKGLQGHSDADVLIHAVIDAIFGAAALGDIGSHFPDTDERYRGISSINLLKLCCEEVRKSGFAISNIDTVVVMQEPKLAPYIEQMRGSLADAMGIDRTRISVKAKTEEKLGFTGSGEGAAAHAAVLIE